MSWLKNLLGGPAAPQISAHEVPQRQKEGALLVDVRELHEWRSGHAPNAKHIPLGQLSQHLSALPREREILFICRSGNRSGQATALARSAGLPATNVSGGMIAWSAAGLPVQRG